MNGTRVKPNNQARSQGRQHNGKHNNNNHTRKKRTDDRKPQNNQGNQNNLSQNQNQTNQSNQGNNNHNNHKRKRPESQEDSSSIVLNKVTYSDEPPVKYISQVGQGTYGKVYKALDRDTNKLLAMKRLRLETQHEGFPVTAAREIKLLQVLRHPNIVRLSEIVVSKNEIYMALDYTEHDLAGLLLNTHLTITRANAKSLIRQSLAALSFLHGKNILHRDIKGSNILVTADGTVKLADFGLARYVDSINSTVRYTNRVITLWYRPPELLLGSEHYGPAVDTWGIGCLLVEVFKRTPLFYGKDEVSQILAIYSIMGIPSPEEWPEASLLPWYRLIDSLPPSGSVPMNRFKKVFSGNDITPACFDLASKLLAMNPVHRISAADALKHGYFSEEPKEQRLQLHMEKEWHDWEAKKRKRDNNEQ